jgi:hypothetical protein
MSNVHDAVAEKMFERITNLKSVLGEVNSIEELKGDTLLINGNILVVFDNHQVPIRMEIIEVDLLVDAEEKLRQVQDE